MNFAIYRVYFIGARSDFVFIPSTTELGDMFHNDSYEIGSCYPYFSGASDAKRKALLDGKTFYYWSRTPFSHYGSSVRLITSSGDFCIYQNSLGRFFANNDRRSARPALNLKSGVLVSEIKK